MASAIHHNFKDRALALLRGAWANRVARFCSYWCGQDGITVTIPENPSGSTPVRVGIDAPMLTMKIVNTMKTVLGIDFTSGEEHNNAIGSADSSFPSDDEDPDYPKKPETSKWEIGDDDGAQSNPNAIGVTFRVVTRIAHDEDNGVHHAFYRELTFSQKGNLLKVSEELGDTQIMA